MATAEKGIRPMIFGAPVIGESEKHPLLLTILVMTVDMTVSLR